MKRDTQYNPNQAGHDLLKACVTFRKVLEANINPLLSIEEKTMKRSAIALMGYNELRAAVITLPK